MRIDELITQSAVLFSHTNCASVEHFCVCRVEPEWLCSVSCCHCITWCSCTGLAIAWFFTHGICPHLLNELHRWEAKVKHDTFPVSW